MKIVNLARRPFENRRPIRRIAGMLWLAGGLVMALNLWLFWDHLTGFATTTGQLSEVRDQIAEEAEKISHLGEAVAALSLEEQNEEVETLNRLITDRAFPWGLLFDRLENVLPDQVWLAAVQPRRANEGGRSPSKRRSGRRSRSRGAGQLSEGVELVLRGQARDSAALRSFVDRLFADPVFLRPQLRNQATSQTGEQDFNLDVRFLVGTAKALTESSAGAVQQQASTDDDGPLATGLGDGEAATRGAVAGLDGDDEESVMSAQVQPQAVVPSATVPPPEDLRTMVGNNVVPRSSTSVPRGAVRKSSQGESSQGESSRREPPRERGTLRTRETARQSAAAPSATTARTPSNTVIGVPIIPAPSFAPPVPTNTNPAPGATRRGSVPTRPSTTRPSTTRPSSTRPSSPDRSERSQPPGQTPSGTDTDPNVVGPEDLEPVPLTPPASSSARIGGGRR